MVLFAVTTNLVIRPLNVIFEALLVAWWYIYNTYTLNALISAEYKASLK